VAPFERAPAVRDAIGLDEAAREEEAAAVRFAPARHHRLQSHPAPFGSQSLGVQKYRSPMPRCRSPGRTTNSSIVPTQPWSLRTGLDESDRRAATPSVSSSPRRTMWRWSSSIGPSMAGRTSRCAV
jgi:hypothetical protein